MSAGTAASADRSPFRDGADSPRPFREGRPFGLACTAVCFDSSRQYDIATATACLHHGPMLNGHVQRTPGRCDRRSISTRYGYWSLPLTRPRTDPFSAVTLKTRPERKYCWPRSKMDSPARLASRSIVRSVIWWCCLPARCRCGGLQRRRRTSALASDPRSGNRTAGAVAVSIDPGPIPELPAISVSAPHTRRPTGERLFEPAGLYPVLIWASKTP